jgi:hypothetical protein
MSGRCMAAGPLHPPGRPLSAGDGGWVLHGSKMHWIFGFLCHVLSFKEMTVVAFI